MKRLIATTLGMLSMSTLLFTACSSNSEQKTAPGFSVDSLTIIAMINQREKAMINRDINAVIKQFDSAASFINGGGYFYEGIAEIRDFHNRMFTNDSLTYTYKIGKIMINSIMKDVAIVYYPWQQQWTLKNIQSDTLNEVGLMTITAIKQNHSWKWKAVTNQRTKEYFDNLQEHKARP